MKQPSKEDLILRWFNNYRNDTTYHSFKLISQSLNIQIENFGDLQEIENRLQIGGYFKARFTITDCNAELPNDELNIA